MRDASGHRLDRTRPMKLNLIDVSIHRTPSAQQQCQKGFTQPPACLNHHDTMQILISDKKVNCFVCPAKVQLRLDISSSPPSPGLSTPSFSPNTTPPFSPLASSSSLLTPRSLERSPLDSLDWSRPISSLLREGTSRAHVEAEHSTGAIALLKGRLPLEEYVRWLVILWRVYSALELGLDEWRDNEVLAGTYDPGVLGRAPALAEDITYLSTLLPASPDSLPDLDESPFPLRPSTRPIFTSPPAPLQAYIARLESLSQSQPHLLLAHAYVRYLGDLSGGQYIGTRIRDAYSLPGADGLQFYQFSRGHGLGEIKAWYRRGMDRGVNDPELKRESVVSSCVDT